MFPTLFVVLRRAQLYNLEALPFTYDQYVVIELADKLYNSFGRENLRELRKLFYTKSPL